MKKERLRGVFFVFLLTGGQEGVTAGLIQQNHLATAQSLPPLTITPAQKIQSKDTSKQKPYSYQVWARFERTVYRH